MMTELKGDTKCGEVETLQMLRVTRGRMQDTPGRWV